jgi:hypothetical protein
MRAWDHNSLIAVALLVSLECVAPAIGKQPQVGFTFSTAAAKHGCMPKLEGPIPNGPNSRAYSRIMGPPEGYVEEEFFVSCYVQGKAYKTIAHVVRPADPRTASGLLIVEPWHPGNNWTIFNSMKDYIVRKHDSAMVVITDPSVLTRFVKPSNEKRYASLFLPNLPLMWLEPEVLAQVGALARMGGFPNLVIRHEILSGHSYTGAETREYIVKEGKKARLNGKSIYDGFFVSQPEVLLVHKPLPDIEVPVVEVQGERELIVDFYRDKGKLPYRRPDGPLYRLYEVPGMSHISTRRHEGANNARDRGIKHDASEPAYTDPRTWNCEYRNLSPFPMNEVKYALLDNLVRWIDKGIPAPHALRIKTKTGKNGKLRIERDQFGNALGGVRTVYFDVPIATYRAVAGPRPKNPNDQRCDWVGSYTPFSHERLLKLYPTHEDYFRKFNSRLESLVKEHWYLPEDAKELRAEAALAAVP